MFGLKFRVECPYFACFRHPTSTSIILTYLIPPYTTIRGLISNAMGLPRDDLRIQDWFKIGIKPVNLVQKNKEMAKILKLKGSDEIYQRKFSSSPMFREFIVNPIYEIYLIGDKEKIIKVSNALENPIRPLYLGISDDLVDLEVLDLKEVTECETQELDCVVEGIYEGCIVEKVPYKFLMRSKRIDLEYKTVSIPLKPLKGKFKAFSFEGELIWAT